MHVTIILGLMRHFFIFLILIYASVKDIKSMEVPNYPFVLILFFANHVGLDSVKNFILVALIYLTIVIAFSIFDRDVPIGMADAKIFASLAFALGLSQAFTIFIYSSLAAGIYAAALLVWAGIIAKRKNRGNTDAQSATLKTAFPYVPFITLGTLGFYLQLWLQSK